MGPSGALDVLAEMGQMDEQAGDLRDLVATVAAAYFSNSHVMPGEIPTVIGQIASGLARVSASVAAPDAAVEPAAPRLTPAQIRRSISASALVSFEDGKPYRTLRRHLSARGLTPDAYRAKWGLPVDYPMVSADYSSARSALAKTLGLGRRAITTARKGPRRPKG